MDMNAHHPLVTADPSKVKLELLPPCGCIELNALLIEKHEVLTVSLKDALELAIGFSFWYAKSMARSQLTMARLKS